MLKQLAPLLPYARRYRHRIAIGLTLVVFSNVFSLAWPYLVKLGIDDLEGGTTAARLAGYAAAIVGFSLVGGIGRYFMRQLLNGMSRRVENDLRDDYFEHLLRLAPDFYSRVPTGELMSRATNDIPAVRMVIGPAIMYLVNTTVVSAIALTMLVLIDLRLTLLAILPLAVVPPLTIYFGREIHKRFEAIQAQFGRISTMAQENLAGSRIVRAYVQEEAQADDFADLNRDYLNRNMRLAKVWGLFHPTLMLLTGLGGVIVLGLGGRDVITGRITVGDFVAFVFYLMQLIWPMIALGWVINLFERGAASMGRIQEVMSDEPSIRDAERPSPITDPRGAIEFQGVWFRYPGGDRYVLRDISFRVEPGQTLAIVGRTGSGKSSIVRLIPRLFDPDRGTILLDDVPIDQIPLEQLRGLIAIVPQEPFLFSETLGANIEFGSQNGDEPARTEAAAQIAQLADAIEDFPRGYETQLGERGINLSGGQKQRATLARALVRQAPVLILDDALSSVDTHTEAAILDGLEEVFRRHTSIIVSHRVTAVKDADRILVVEDGTIVERGTHAELLQAGGIYARLLRRQLLEESLEIEDGGSLAGSARP
ncbi:MAG: ABC transporter ATP-binding protein [Gemmatimonadetes bacterium]|uniref:Multidrug resistance-like ATP-binding protein MdlA n=1 Tax=Candidatus Kutchimonas denitrificans TaxID=3056748 RepID=A0AAE4ZA48_9BACT|nr:ABC transporter ATP-binding protein [Gemmatimonadota bacterium]NIR74351.1 ABC transporter ATP-binding protein [Candidatus Kutchimonas denitrificans]NIS02602.1 ABC transporter ATP-binding protein [Gemmatimonadota bacterium]NIT68477.1 ABC transporter ATP-binding protein [Gemmatimonadota bacterium]NIU51954.1 ATP-binding cassette domain-containing protein [Gemmatimonadota bacterium]